MSDTQYDVVVIGGGHNGLTCAAYLALAGLSVHVLEKRAVVGGAAVTEEFHPGFRNSVCSYTVGLLNPSVIQDLDLHGHGMRVVERPMSNFLPLEGGDSLRLYQGARGRDEIARHSAHDAAQLSDYQATLGRLAEVLRSTILEAPPNPGGSLADWWSALKVGRRMTGLDRATQQDLADIMVMSAVDFLERWFESDAVKTLFAFDGIVGTMASPYSPGTAYVLLHHCFGEVNGKRGVWGHAIGGMGAVTQAIRASAEAAGATIEVDAAVAQVLLEAGRAVGVRLENGRVIRAAAVAANVGPRLLFDKMVDPNALEADFRGRMQRFKCCSGTFRMNVALSSLPRFSSAPEPGDHLGSGIIMAPSLAYMDQAYQDARQLGWSRRPIVEMLIPSTLDDTLAPDGQHVASLFCQHFNPDLPDGRSWDQVRDQAAEAIIDAVCEFAPNFRQAIVGRQILSPLDLEREFGLIGGDIFHGTLDLNQLYSLRPTLGHADYAMPLGGLYLCGSGAHPGGGVTGAPGHNAARRIVKDSGKRWRW